MFTEPGAVFAVGERRAPATDHRAKFVGVNATPV